VRPSFGSHRLSKIPSSRSWMMNSVPGFHPCDVMRAFGGTSRPPVDSFVVSFIDGLPFTVFGASPESPYVANAEFPNRAALLALNRDPHRGAEKMAPSSPIGARSFSRPAFQQHDHEREYALETLLVHLDQFVTVFLAYRPALCSRGQVAINSIIPGVRFANAASSPPRDPVISRRACATLPSTRSGSARAGCAGSGCPQARFIIGAAHVAGFKFRPVHSSPGAAFSVVTNCQTSRSCTPGQPTRRVVRPRSPALFRTIRSPAALMSRPRPRH
jgi:hypothetical protein